MNPINYNLDVVSPIQKVMQMVQMADAKKDRKFSKGMQTRQADRADRLDAQSQANQNRRMTLAEKQAMLAERNADRSFERGVLESDRQFDYGKARDEVGDQYRDKGIEMQEQEIALQRQRAEQASADRAQKNQRQKKMQEDLSAFANKPNKTADDFIQMSTKYPEMTSQLKSMHELMDKDSQKNALRDATQVYGALTGGSVETAKNVLQRRLEDAKKRGDQREHASAMSLLKTIEANPEAGRIAAGMYLAAVNNGTDFAYTLNALEKTVPGNTTQDIRSLGELGREAGLSQSKINRVLSETRGASLNERKAAMMKMIESTDGAFVPEDIVEEVTVQEDDSGLTAEMKTFLSSPVPEKFKGQTIEGGGKTYVDQNGKWVEKK
jgi:hypothetical protein